MERLLAWGGVGHLSLENTVDPEPPNSAPSPFSNPNDESAPAPPTDGRMMHSSGEQGDGDEDDVNSVE